MIRRTTKDDIGGIEKLYARAKNSTELGWLLPDPLTQNPFRSFVAVLDHKIVGHIGYVISKFQYKTSTFSGVHPQAWIVSPEYRKLGIGLKLMTRVLDMADFSYLIGGSKATMRIFPDLGFTLKFFVLEYVKSLESPCTEPASFTDKGAISLEKYDKKEASQIQFSNAAFMNAQANSHIKWLLACPLCDTYAFSIKQDGRHLGMAICYAGKNKDDILTGRIVHLSYLGDHLNSWRQTLFEIEKFFRGKDCRVIAALATHPAYISALIESGYSQRPDYPVAAFNDNGRPFFLRDPRNNLSHIPDDAFHWTFLEGDMGYRNF
jgi:GNAT superfamily N-acetyltransferase